MGISKNLYAKLYGVTSYSINVHSQNDYLCIHKCHLFEATEKKVTWREIQNFAPHDPEPTKVKSFQDRDLSLLNITFFS